MYSFVLATEKGEKSAGNVVVDLAEFINNRLYCISFMMKKLIRHFHCRNVLFLVLMWR